MIGCVLGGWPCSMFWTKVLLVCYGRVRVLWSCSYAMVVFVCYGLGRVLWAWSWARAGCRTVSPDASLMHLCVCATKW